MRHYDPPMVEVRVSCILLPRLNPRKGSKLNHAISHEVVIQSCPLPSGHPFTGRVLPQTTNRGSGFWECTKFVYVVSLNLQAELEPVDEQPNDDFVPLNVFRKANSFSSYRLVRVRVVLSK